VRGGGVDVAVAGGARHVMPVTLCIMKGSVLHGVSPGRWGWTGAGRTATGV